MYPQRVCASKPRQEILIFSAAITTYLLLLVFFFLSLFSYIYINMMMVFKKKNERNERELGGYTKTLTEIQNHPQAITSSWSFTRSYYIRFFNMRQVLLFFWYTYNIENFLYIRRIQTLISFLLLL